MYSLPAPAFHCIGANASSYQCMNQRINTSSTNYSDFVQNESTPDIPPELHVPEFKSWTKGVVTEITPSLRYTNCTKLMNGDAMELEEVNQILSENITFYINSNFSNCAEISRELYDNFYISESESNFPIAYALVVHTNAQQTLRFLKAIYRPQNLYCIHPDPRSGPNFTEIFRHIAHCIPNVFLPSELHKVDYYKPHTIFEAQMSCFKDLEAHPHKWRYVINLCSRELPLKTNHHIIECLRNMNGTSVLSPYPIDTFTLKDTFTKKSAF